MKFYIMAIMMLFISLPLFSQNQFKAIVKDKESNEPLIGVSAYVYGTNNGSSSDAEGLLTINNIPDGKQ